MRVLVQRVRRAAVRQMEATEEAHIDIGLLLLVGFRDGDDATRLQWMAEKCVGLRVFADAHGAMNQSVSDIGGALLVVPNFTLYGDARKGRRPSFGEAAPPEVAERLFDDFVNRLRRTSTRVETGFFRTHMQVELVNDGPVTLWLER